MVLSESAHVTNGQTDGQNYDSQDRASIATRAVKITFRTLVINVLLSSKTDESK